ncbi:MAG: exonuclease domain-containing protein [Anaerolineae bacterium]|nr:exonuclease domain-containing protein [Anaerolineae bacterium]
MGGKLDQVLVIDVEATCWENGPPPDQDNEIIEIGICMLDVATGARLSKQSLLVQPTHSNVSEFCTELTTLTPEQVADGIAFEHACALLRRQYQSSDRVWASYGDYDRRQFERQCQQQHVPYPFGTSHINVKNLFALIYGLHREVGMMRALSLLNVEPYGVHHRGVDDAWNTAQILSHLLIRSRPVFRPEGQNGRDNDNG